MKQLFILPFAGGNCYSFQFMLPHLSGYFDIHVLELPGRGKRMKEELIRSRQAAILDYLEQLSSKRNGSPFMIYGHSMGALLSLNVCQRLEEKNDPPSMLFVTGNAGPGTGENKQRHKMNDKELKAELRSLGGVPEEVLTNKDLYDFFSPVLKADFEILESDFESYETEKPLNTGIYAVMGSAEETAEEIQNWKNFTTGYFQSEWYDGNHFFIHDYPSELSNLIKSLSDKFVVPKY